MIAVSLAADRSHGEGSAVYRVAGEDLLLAGTWPELAAFRRDERAQSDRRAQPDQGAQLDPLHPPPEARFADLRYDGPAAIGDGATALTCLHGDDGYLLRASPGPTLWVANDGWRIAQSEPGDASPATVSAELLFGPALLLALAVRGTYALHASAVRWGESAVAFVGPSGAGKSTLASLLAAPAVGCERVADDIVPFVVADGTALLRPAFPQLKLAAAEQWSGPRPESLPLAAVYRLAPIAGGGATPAMPRIEPLRGAEALAVLMAHSVATALFGPQLLRRHFDAVAALSRSLRIAELHLPRRLDVAPQVRDLLQEDLDLRDLHPRKDLDD